MLREEICRLRRLKGRLEEAREVPAWLQEDTSFQQLLNTVRHAARLAYLDVDQVPENTG